jgi:hypothetical protein
MNETLEVRRPLLMMTLWQFDMESHDSKVARGTLRANCPSILPNSGELQSRCAPITGHLVAAAVQPAAHLASTCSSGKPWRQSSGVLSAEWNASLCADDVWRAI